MIDSNQTRFQLLLGRDDWAHCTARDGSSIIETPQGANARFSWNESRSELTLGWRINVFHSAPGNQPPTIAQRRGAAQDCYGNFYWISESGTEILVNSSGTGTTSHFWASEDESGKCPITGFFFACQTETPEPAFAFDGLVVTEEHYLVAGVLEPKGLVIFDLFHGGPPRRLLWPSTVPFVPFDMAPAPGGGVWILDRVHRLLWELDRTFAVVPDNQPEVDVNPSQPDTFSPADGTVPQARPPRMFPAGISLESALPLVSIDAVALEALPDGSVLLLETNPQDDFSVIHRFRDHRALGAPISVAGVLDRLSPQDRPGFKLLGFDFAFIASEQICNEKRLNTLYVVGQNGDQSWAFSLAYEKDQLDLTPLPEYYPMRLFGGRGLISGRGHVYYDSQARFIPLIMQNRPRYVEEATLFTPELDGKQFGCVWHKLMLDAAIPPGTAVQVWSRAHNDRNFLKFQDWFLEPRPYLRGNGTELPWTNTPAGLGTWEFLFQRAVGQYLQLKITLYGNGISAAPATDDPGSLGNAKLTPRIRALRTYYPRFSYLEHYLPGIYREDDRSASFLDRFLANIEGFYTSIEDRIATIQALLDVGSAPSEALDWLANWFGVALDPAWTEAKRRLFLSNATKFFEARGTVHGLMMALRLALEDCADPDIFAPRSKGSQGPRIVEGFSTRRLPPGLFLQPISDSGLPIKQQTVVWTPSQGADELNSRYKTQALASTYPTYLPPSDPHYKQWSAFSMLNLGLVPSRPDSGSELWSTFLRTRYGSIGILSKTYGITYSSFSDVPFPAELARKSQALWDWYQFQGVLLIQAAAHQFTVFLPMPPGDAQNVIAHRNKMNLARRVIDLEKPAHTEYEIKFYWAFFRVGEARLGKDSVLDYGSRAPQLLRPVLLGDTYLGSGYLAQPPQRPFLKQRSC